MSTQKQDLDPQHSSEKGVAGIAEVILRRFKILTHILALMPVYFMGATCIAVSLLPGFYLYDWVSGFAMDWEKPLRFFAQALALACSYFLYGFTLILAIPAMNFILRGKLKPWRGPYYSLPSVRWYVHNGLTYLARYTFLEFVTPTPFGILFYKLMGMKIGRGAQLNTTAISDPSLIELGEKATIGGSATIIAHYGMKGLLVISPVKIGKGATIGLRAIIMGGVEVGDGSVVLPNSVVLPKTIIPAGETWGGVPARKIDLRKAEAE